MLNLPYYSSSPSFVQAVSFHGLASGLQTTFSLHPFILPTLYNSGPSPWGLTLADHQSSGTSQAHFCLLPHTQGPFI